MAWEAPGAWDSPDAVDATMAWPGPSRETTIRGRWEIRVEQHLVPLPEIAVQDQLLAVLQQRVPAAVGY